MECKRCEGAGFRYHCKRHSGDCPCALEYVCGVCGGSGFADEAESGADDADELEGES